MLAIEEEEVEAGSVRHEGGRCLVQNLDEQAAKLLFGDAAKVHVLLPFLDGSIVVAIRARAPMGLPWAPSALDLRAE